MMSFRLSLLIVALSFACFALACGLGACSSTTTTVADAAPDVGDDDAAPGDDADLTTDVALSDTLVADDTLNAVDVGDDTDPVLDIVVEGSGDDEGSGTDEPDDGSATPTDGSAEADAGFPQARACARTCLG